MSNLGQQLTAHYTIGLKDLVGKHGPVFKTLHAVFWIVILQRNHILVMYFYQAYDDGSISFEITQ